MPGPRLVVVHRDPGLLAAAAAARLVTRLVDGQASRGEVAVVLTGGGLGIAVLEALAGSPARDAVDWKAVDIWWGDERFLPAGHPERNETQARAALLDRVPVDPDRVHAMPASDGPDGDDVDAAAARYGELLARAAQAQGRSRVPRFDVLLLGVGPAGHVASLFPGHPATYEEDRTVVGVRGAPKPPPVRVSLTFPTINSADDVWLATAGADRARIVHLALTGAGPLQVPAAGVEGTRRTLWLLDEAAAGQARALSRPASP
jgi:6-phosphogluconolactonase